MSRLRIDKRGRTWWPWAAACTWLAMVTPAWASFGQPRLVAGTPEFTGCLNSTECADNFYRFFGQALLEQGFALQHHNPITSVVTNAHDGWTVGGALRTFPFAPPRANLSGKTENTSFSPVFPELTAGWSRNPDDEWACGASLFVLPPIPVKGASALLLGTEISAARGVGNSRRFGLEGDFTFVRAQAPVVASQEQFDDRENTSNPDHFNEATFEENCASTDEGCLDTMTLTNIGLRATHAWMLGQHWVPYTKVGLTVVNQRIHVMYDDTTWAVFALQPSVHVGTGLTLGETWLLSLGGSAALKQANQSPDGLGLFTKLEGGLGVRF